VVVEKQWILVEGNICLETIQICRSFAERPKKEGGQKGDSVVSD